MGHRVQDFIDCHNYRAKYNLHIGAPVAVLDINNNLITKGTITCYDGDMILVNRVSYHHTQIKLIKKRGEALQPLIKLKPITKIVYHK